ncbi:MAG: HTTM domain-containing protein [Myxococcota bacterium]
MGVAAKVRRGVARALDATLLETEDPTALGLLRILVVSVMTASMLTHIGSVAEYFSDDAWLAGDAARQAFHSRWSVFFYVSDPWAVRAIFTLGVVAHLLWIVGLFTPVAAFVAWAVWASMVGRNPLLYALPDALHGVMAFLMMLLPTGRGLSLDARRHGPRPVPIWCRRVVQAQIAVVYVATGLLKTGKTWRADGTALYYTLANPYNRHFSMAPLLASLQPYVLRPMTWVVLAWEVGFGGFVVSHWLRETFGRPRRWPDLRWVFLGFGLLMHAGIQALLYVAWFTPMMMASYAAFLRPEETRAILGRLARLRRSKRAREEALRPDEADAELESPDEVAAEDANEDADGPGTT